MAENLNLFGKDGLDEFIDVDNPIPLIERWIVPPFSVLDARQGYWQKRKRQWLALGIKGELGRGENIVPNSTTRLPEHDGVWRRDFGKKQFGRCYGQDLMKGENAKFGQTRSYHSQEWVIEKGIKGNASNLTGTSIFDPVLCEIIYQWFCPEGGHVLDPFAGGSVRGIVATELSM